MFFCAFCHGSDIFLRERKIISIFAAVMAKWLSFIVFALFLLGWGGLPAVEESKEGPDSRECRVGCVVCEAAVENGTGVGERLYGYDTPADYSVALRSWTWGGHVRKTRFSEDSECFLCNGSSEVLPRVVPGPVVEGEVVRALALSEPILYYVYALRRILI